jgi:hypothetical protein
MSYIYNKKLIYYKLIKRQIPLHSVEINFLGDVVPIRSIHPFSITSFSKITSLKYKK